MVYIAMTRTVTDGKEKNTLT